MHVGVCILSAVQGVSLPLLCLHAFQIERGRCSAFELEGSTSPLLSTYALSSTVSGSKASKLSAPRIAPLSQPHLPPSTQPFLESIAAPCRTDEIPFTDHTVHRAYCVVLQGYRQSLQTNLSSLQLDVRDPITRALDQVRTQVTTMKLPCSLVICTS